MKRTRKVKFDDRTGLDLNGEDYGSERRREGIGKEVGMN